MEAAHDDDRAERRRRPRLSLVTEPGRHAGFRYRCLSRRPDGGLLDLGDIAVGGIRDHRSDGVPGRGRRQCQGRACAPPGRERMAASCWRTLQPSLRLNAHRAVSVTDCADRVRSRRPVQPVGRWSHSRSRAVSVSRRGTPAPAAGGPVVSAVSSAASRASAREARSEPDEAGGSVLTEAMTVSRSRAEVVRSRSEGWHRSRRTELSGSRPRPVPRLATVSW